MTWHRHAFEIRPLSVENYETVQIEYKLKHGLFRYCPICKGVPTKFLGPDPELADDKLV